MAHARKLKTKAAISSDPVKPATPKAFSRDVNKASAIIALLKSKRGATIPELMEATDWQSHSVRGLLAGALRSRHGLDPVSEKRDGELRRYRAR